MSKRPAKKAKKKPVLKSRYFVLDADPFKTDVGVAVNLTGKELLTIIEKDKWQPRPAVMDRLKTISAEWDEAQAKGRTTGQMHHVMGGFMVFLKTDEDGFRETMGLLTHELTHVVQRLLRDRDTPLVGATEEVYAYMIDHLVVKALEQMY